MNYTKIQFNGIKITIIVILLSIIFSMIIVFQNIADNKIIVSDKATICYSQYICDDTDTIYFIYNSKIAKIDKINLTFTNTDISAISLFQQDGDIFHIYRGNVYKNENLIISGEFLGEYLLISDNVVYITGSSIGTYVYDLSSGGSVVDIMRHNFPVIDNHSDIYIVNVEESDDFYYNYYINGVKIGETYSSYIPYNDRYFLYNNQVYYCENNSIYKISLDNGKTEKIIEEAEYIIAVAHGFIYYINADTLYKTTLDGRKLNSCLNTNLSVYVDSYEDIVYLIDFNSNPVSCKIAVFK